MRSGPTNRPTCDRDRRGGRSAQRGFTLAETLAALLFLAIVIPVAVQGIQLASYAGQVSRRKIVAARIGDRVLNEMIATGTWQSGSGSGTATEGPLEFRYNSKVESWTEGTLRVLTVEVTFTVQGRLQNIQLSTLVDPTAP
jgi:Tfp pilus assembly protein PilV